MSASIDQHTKITMATYYLERSHESWPWRLVKKEIEEVSLVQVRAACDQKWRLVMDEDFGGTSNLRHNVSKFWSEAWIGPNKGKVVCWEDDQPSRLITTSPDRLQRTVRHWQYRRKVP